MKLLLVLTLILPVLCRAESLMITSISLSPEHHTKPSEPELVNRVSACSHLPQSEENKGTAKIVRLSETKDLLKTIYSSSFSRFARMQQQIPQGIVISSGKLTIEQLARQFPNEISLFSSKTYVATLPIIIDIGAALIIDNATSLLLSQSSGSFIHNNGTLLICHAEVKGWVPEEQSVSFYAGDSTKFRPFIISFGGSKTYLQKAKLESLGFDEPSSYGLTIRTATEATLNMLTARERMLVSQPPTLDIVESAFDDLFISVYLDGAESSRLVSNSISNSIDTGVLVTNASDNIYIGNNQVKHTQHKHGLVISNEVTNSYVMNNKVVRNARSGILIDSAGTSSVIAFNEVHDNSKDGITVYDSVNIRLFGNQIYNNRTHGIHLRDSQAVKIHHNIIVGNLGVATYMHKQKSEVSAEVIGGLFVENASGAVFADGLKELTLGALRLENNGSKNFRGQLQTLEASIILASWKEGSAAHISQKVHE